MDRLNGSTHNIPTERDNMARSAIIVVHICGEAGAVPGNDSGTKARLTMVCEMRSYCS
jgi:hypothetical protein